jgi:tetratricopeptide (TPR) repeat protein
MSCLFFFCFAMVLMAQDLVPVLLDQGLKFYAAKDYSGAADYLGQVVDMSPEHEQARFYLVYSLAMSGNREKALEHAKNLVKRFPAQKNYEALVTQLQGEIAREKTEKDARVAAVAVPKEVVLGGYKSKDVIKEPRISTQTYNIAPVRPKTELELAIEKIDEENYEAATSMFAAILAKEPKNALARHYLGVIRFNNGEYQDAIKEFNQAIALDSKNFQSYFLLGDCFRALDDLKKAEEYFRKALQIKEDVFAMLNIAEVMVRQGRVKEAEEMFEKVYQRDSNITDAKIGLSQIKLQKGFIEEAAEMINQVIAAGTGNPEAHYTKAQIMLEHQLYESASEEARKAMQIVPGNLKYRSLYALCLVRGYTVPQGLEEAGKIITEYPDSNDARLVLAEGLILSGASGDAEDHLQDVEKRVKHPQVSRLRALDAVKKGETEKARAFYLEYMERSAGQARPALEYAQFLESVDQQADALQAYYEIAEQFPDTAYALTAREGVARLEDKKKAAAEQERQEKTGLRPGKVKF